MLDGQWMIKICVKLPMELVGLHTLLEMLQICTLMIFNFIRKKGLTALGELKLHRLRGSPRTANT